MSVRSPRLPSLVAGLALLAAPRAATAQKLLEILPKGTLAFVGTDDVLGLEADWHESSTGRLHATAEFAEFQRTYATEMEAAFEASLPGLHIDFAQAADLLAGPCGAACLQFEPPADAAGEPALAFALIAGVKGHADEAQDFIDDLVKHLAEKGLVVSRAQEGETAIVTLRPDGDAPAFELRVAIYHDTLLASVTMGASKTDWLARLFDALDGKGADSLGERPEVRASPAGATGPELRVWFDLQRGWQIGRAFLLASSSSRKTSSKLEVFDRLGLATIGGLSMRLTYGADGSGGTFRLDWPAGPPLRDALAQFLAPAKGQNLLELAPPAALAGGTLQLDWDGLFESVLRCFQEGGQVPPSVVSAALADTNKSLGFDLDGDLLSRLDGRLAAFVAEVPAAEAFSVPGMPAGALSLNGLLAVGTSDGKGLNELVDAQIHRAGLHAGRQTTDLLGFEINHVPIFPGLSVDYAVLPDVLLVSTSPTLVQDAVRRSATPDLPDFATRPEMVAQRAHLPAAGAVMEGDSAAWMVLQSRIQAAAAEKGVPSGPGPFGDNLFSHLLRAAETAGQKMPRLDEALAKRYFAAPTVSVSTVDDAGFTCEMLSP